MNESSIHSPFNLSATTFGKGRVVVLLHGFLEDATMWDFLKQEALEAQFICIDLPGHGESESATNSPSIANIASDVQLVIDTFTLGSYTLIGHSLGGYVGLELALTTNRVSDLILVHSHPFDDSPQKKNDRDRVVSLVKTAKNNFIRTAIPNLFAHPEKHPIAISSYCEIAEKMTAEAIGWSTIAMRDRPNYSMDLFPNTTISIIHGQKDPIIPLHPLKDWVEANNHTWIEIPDCGHMSQIEQPNLLVTSLRSILEKRF